jgi:hypothetical protein
LKYGQHKKGFIIYKLGDLNLSKKTRQEKASVGVNTARSYRNKILAKQAKKLLEELEKNRNEKDSSPDGIITQRVVKNKSTRIAYRVVGIIFAALGVAFFWWAMGGSYRMLKCVVAVAALMYGFYLIKASFRKEAFDTTYLFGPEVMTVLYKKGSVTVPYSRVTAYNMIEPDPELKYCIMKIDCGKKSYIVPFGGAKKKCQQVYDILKEKVEIDEEENS